jgi:hypothetical protein
MFFYRPGIFVAYADIVYLLYQLNISDIECYEVKNWNKLLNQLVD